MLLLDHVILYLVVGTCQYFGTNTYEKFAYIIAIAPLDIPKYYLIANIHKEIFNFQKFIIKKVVN